jgi:hypothetical protein
VYSCAMSDNGSGRNGDIYVGGNGDGQAFAPWQPRSTATAAWTAASVTTESPNGR